MFHLLGNQSHPVDGNQRVLMLKQWPSEFRFRRALPVLVARVLVLVVVVWCGIQEEQKIDLRTDEERG